MPRTKAFPRNTEVEATLTFVTKDRPGALISGVTPVPTLVTVREHHSFVALPEPGYKPRRLDPRVGIFGIEFYDYASPVHRAAREALDRAASPGEEGPDAAVSEPVKPIVYYVDNGVPEPIRSALVEGRVVVEPGLRGGRLPERVPGEGAARRTPIRWTSATT